MTKEDLLNLEERLDIIELKLERLIDNLLPEDEKKTVDMYISDIKTYYWEKRMGEDL